MARSPLERLVEAVAGLGIAICAGGGYLALRTLAWGQAHLLEAMLLSGAAAAAVIAAVGGLAYVLLGRLVTRALSIDWMSARVGACLGAALYGVYHTLAPLTMADMMAEAGARALQGALDGVLIGGVLGLVTAFVSRRSLTFERASLLRFGLLYLVLLLIAGIIVVVDSFIRLPDAAFVVLSIPAVLALRLAVLALDRRADALAQG
jgi:hypothetical protein